MLGQCNSDGRHAFGWNMEFSQAPQQGQKSCTENSFRIFFCCLIYRQQLAVNFSGLY